MMKRAAIVSMILALVSGWIASAASAADASSDGKAYIGLVRDDAVAVLDTGTNRVLRTIPRLPRPHGIVATADGHKVYVSSEGGWTISVIDTVTDHVVRTLEVGSTPHGLTISPDGARWWWRATVPIRS